MSDQESAQSAERSRAILSASPPPVLIIVSALGRALLTLLLATIGFYILVRFVLAANFSGTPSDLQSLPALLTGELFAPAESSPLEASRLFGFFLTTSGIVAIAYTSSTILSILLGYLAALPIRPWYLPAVRNGFMFFNALPLFLGGLLSYFFINVDSPFPFLAESLLLKIALAGVILGSMEGGLGGYPRLYTGVFRQMIGMTYYQSRLARGQSLFPLIVRHSLPHVTTSIATRLGALYGSAIVVETSLALSNGAGATILNLLRAPEQSMAYQQLMFLGKLVLAVPIFVGSLVVAAQHLRERTGA